MASIMAGPCSTLIFSSRFLGQKSITSRRTKNAANQPLDAPLTTPAGGPTGNSTDSLSLIRDCTRGGFDRSDLQTAAVCDRWCAIGRVMPRFFPRGFPLGAIASVPLRQVEAGSCETGQKLAADRPTLSRCKTQISLESRPTKVQCERYPCPELRSPFGLGSIGVLRKIPLQGNSPLPVPVVRGRKIGPQVDAPGFFPAQRRGDHQPGHGQHVLQFPAAGVGKLPRQHVSAPAVDIVGRLGQLAAHRGERRPIATSGS